MWLGESDDSYSTQEKGHGRLETRLCIAGNDLSPLGDLAYDGPALKTIGIVATIRQEKGQLADLDYCVFRRIVNSHSG